MIEIIIFLTVFIGLELFETNWQKATSFYELIKNNFNIYDASIWLYFSLNPTFIYALFLAIYLNNFTFWMSFIIVLKFADISFRLYLMQKISNDESITSVIPVDMPMTLPMRYFNVFLYPVAFLFANI